MRFLPRERRTAQRQSTMRSRTGGRVRITDEQLDERNQHDEQNEERHRADRVHHEPDHLIDRMVRREQSVLREVEQHGEGGAEHHADQCGHTHHEERVPQRFAEIVLQNLQRLAHASTSSLSVRTSFTSPYVRSTDRPPLRQRMPHHRMPQIVVQSSLSSRHEWTCSASSSMASCTICASCWRPVAH